MPSGANNYATTGSGYKTKAANEIELYLDSNSHSSGELTGCADTTEIEKHISQQQHTRHFTLSPDTTDFDSNCGDLDGSLNDGATIAPTDYGRLCTSMPILEDGLSSGHASDTDNNNTNLAININSELEAENDVENGSGDQFVQRSSAVQSENNSKLTVIFSEKKMYNQNQFPQHH